MQSYRHHETGPTGPPPFAGGKLPSFNQFVSSLEKIGPEEQLHHPPRLQDQKPDVVPRTQSPALLPACSFYEGKRGSFSNILNPVTDDHTRPAQRASPPRPVSLWKAIQTPRDAYQIRQGLLPSMKPLQPRGDIPAYRPVHDLTLRNSNLDNDLTLAGKPRKRSAQACQRCREMKIKCRIHGTGCITCLRQGLECAFEPARSGLRNRRSKRDKDATTSTDADHTSTSDTTNSPPPKRLCPPGRRSTEDFKETSPAMPFSLQSRIPSLHSSAGSPEHSDQQQQDGKQRNSTVPLPYRSVSEASLPPTPPAEPEVDGYAASLRRISSISSSSSATISRPEHSSRDSSWNSIATASTNTTVADGPSQRRLTVDDDPFDESPTLAIAALRHFYSSSVYRQFTDAKPGEEHDGSSLPSIEAMMVRWHVKSSNERMLLYAMLAAGATAAVDTPRLSREEVGNMARFGVTCRTAAESFLRTVSYRFDMVVVQTQLILRAGFTNGR